MISIGQQSAAGCRSYEIKSCSCRRTSEYVRARVTNTDELMRLDWYGFLEASERVNNVSECDMSVGWLVLGGGHGSGLGAAKVHVQFP